MKSQFKLRVKYHNLGSEELGGIRMVIDSVVLDQVEHLHRNGPRGGNHCPE